VAKKRAACSHRSRHKKPGTHAIQLKPEINLPPSPPPTIQVPAPVVNVPPPVVNLPAPNIQVLPAPPATETSSLAALREALRSYINNPLGIKLFTASQVGIIDCSGILRAIQADGLAVIEPSQAIPGELLYFPLDQITGFHFPFYQQDSYTSV